MPGDLKMLLEEAGVKYLCAQLPPPPTRPLQGHCKLSSGYPCSSPTLVPEGGPFSPKSMRAVQEWLLAMHFTQLLSLSY